MDRAKIVIELERLHSQLEQVAYNLKKLHTDMLISKVDEVTKVNAALLLTLVTDNAGHTANELAGMVGADKEAVRKLLYSLAKKKLVVNSGHKICEVTNNETYCWYPK